MNKADENLFNTFKKRHNPVVGILFLLILASYSVLIVIGENYMASIFDKLFSVFFILELALILILLIFVAKNNKERYQISELASPLQTLVPLFIVIIVVINLFSIEFIVPPFSSRLTYLGIFPLAYLWWIESVFWEPNGTNPKTEGEKKGSLTEQFITTSGAISVLVTLIFLREIFQNKRVDYLVLTLVNLPTFFVSVYYWIKVDWLESEFSKKINFRLTVVAILNACLYVILYSQFTSYFGTISTTKIVFMASYYLFTIGGCIVFFNNLKSTTTLLWLTVLSLPVTSSGLLRYLDLNELFSISIPKQTSQLLFDGFIWVVGALLGSLIFSFIAVLFKKRKVGRIDKPLLNDADLDEISATTSISLKIAKELIDHKPYKSKEEVVERVKGIGNKRLKYLSDKFQI